MDPLIGQPFHRKIPSATLFNMTFGSALLESRDRDDTLATLVMYCQ